MNLTDIEKVQAKAQEIEIAIRRRDEIGSLINEPCLQEVNFGLHIGDGYISLEHLHKSDRTEVVERLHAITTRKVEELRKQLIEISQDGSDEDEILPVEVYKTKRH